MHIVLRVLGTAGSALLGIGLFSRLVVLFDSVFMVIYETNVYDV